MPDVSQIQNWWRKKRKKKKKERMICTAEKRRFLTNMEYFYTLWIWKMSENDCKCNLSKRSGWVSNLVFYTQSTSTYGYIIRATKAQGVCGDHKTVHVYIRVLLLILLFINENLHFMVRQTFAQHNALFTINKCTLFSIHQETSKWVNLHIMQIHLFEYSLTECAHEIK